VFSALGGKARSLLDEDRLYELAVEERRLDVEVVDALILRYCQGQQQANGLHSRHRSKDFLEVNALMLHEATSDETSLVLDNDATLIPLHLIDPLQADRPTATGGSTSSHVLLSSMAFISSNIARH